MTKRIISLILITTVLLLPVSGFALHYGGHGLKAQKPQSKFDLCKDYPDLDAQKKQQYQNKYQQQCQQTPAGSPKKVAPGQIKSIYPPRCLNKNSEFKVTGQHLHKGLTCRLQSRGNKRTLRKPSSQSENQFSYGLQAVFNELPGPDFTIACEIDGNRKSVNVRACPRDQGQKLPAGQPGKIDLIPQIQTQVVRPGELHTLQVEINFRGATLPGNPPLWIEVYLTDRDDSNKKRPQGNGPPAKFRLMHRVPGDGRSVSVDVAIFIPPQTNLKQYFWCVFANSKKNQSIREFNVRNNRQCVPARPADSQKPDKLAGLFGSKIQGQKHRDIDPVILGDTSTESRLLPIMADPRHSPLPAGPDCDPTVYMWFDREPLPAVGVSYGFFFDDSGASVHYSVDCATSVSVFDVEHLPDYPGPLTDHGAGAVFYSDAAAAGVLTGSHLISPGTSAGIYAWRISATNNLGDPLNSASERLLWGIRNHTAESIDADTSLNIYETPWRNFCSRDDYVFEGNLSATVNYTGSDVFPARIIIHLGSSSTSTNINIRSGRQSYRSANTRIPKDEICSDSCLQYHLEARNLIDAPKIDSSLRSACAP